MPSKFLPKTFTPIHPYNGSPPIIKLDGEPMTHDLALERGYSIIGYEHPDGRGIVRVDPAKEDDPEQDYLVEWEEWHGHARVGD
jgi:hypothetical protein